MKDANKSAVMFDKFIRGQYNHLKAKTDKTKDDQYILDNYLNYALAADMFVVGTIEPNHEYDFDFNFKFDIPEDDLKKLYEKYEEPENLDTCKIGKDSKTSGDYIYTLCSNFVEEDEEGDILYHNTLKYYLNENLDLQDIKNTMDFYHIQISRFSIKEQNTDPENDIDFSVNFKTYQLSKED